MSDERATPPSFDPLPEDWQTALFVVAHPDDIEYGSAAAVARWTGQGKKVVYCMVTSGEAGIDGLSPDEETRMAALKVQLDQAWDYLRQRRAYEQSGLDPDDASERDPETVEDYEG